jgi:DNA-binding response OmpR family regulator
MDADVFTLPQTRRRPQGAPSSRRRKTGREPGQKPRILVVEDEYLVATEIEAGLIERGFDVVGIATTAADAIRLAKAERPTLIVMDIRLAGGRDGIEAAKEIYQTSGIRCLFATAYTEATMRNRAGPAAPLGWLAKPYAIEGLIAAIRVALNQLEQ